MRALPIHPMVQKGLNNWLILAYPVLTIHKIPAEGAKRNNAPSKAIKDDFRPAICLGGQMTKLVRKMTDQRSRHALSSR